MLSILRKARLKDKELRILMLTANVSSPSGLDNAGKTTIVKSLLGEDVGTVSPTLGFIIKTIDYDGYKLNICKSSTFLFLSLSLVSIAPPAGTNRQRKPGDVGGQKTLRSYWRNYFEKTDALVWVVDATDRVRAADCRAELAGLLGEERLAGATLLVFANKMDVAGAMREDEVAQLLELGAIRSHVWHILPCSAVAGTNLREGLAWVVADAKKRLFLY